MTATNIQEQVQNGIDARTDMDMPLGVGIALSRAYRRMLGLDGTSVPEAAQVAYTPTGPSLDQIETRIRARRAEIGIPA